MTKVFIDGSAGTTGLRIADRLEGRDDVSLIRLPEERRKELSARKKAINGADVVFLCLPDDAAAEAVELVENDDVRIIDTSTAHRTADGWTYGFAELSGQRERIAASKRIANPGCHASGFVALVAPLVESGIVSSKARLSCFSLTGYSGGGKKMIADYESRERRALLGAPRQYSLGQRHKHLKEMTRICGLESAPAFCPVVADFYSGMEVTVPLFACDINGTAEDIKALYKRYYANGLVRYDESDDGDGMLSASALAGRDCMLVSVFGNEDRILLTVRFDNLGKGASGAAIQNFNILISADETKGLII